MVNHDHNDNVEGIEEEVVDHLDVGGLGHVVVDGGLHVGNDQHHCDGHHNSVLQKGCAFFIFCTGDVIYCTFQISVDF